MVLGMTEVVIPRWLRRCDVEQYYPVLTLGTLVTLASRGEGPSYRFVGRHAVYASADIEAWLSQGQVKPGTGRPKPRAKAAGEREGRQRVTTDLDEGRRGRPKRAEARRRKAERELSKRQEGDVPRG